MANTVLLKRSSVAGKVPQTTDLSYGELSINYADGVLWYKKSDNTVNPLNSVVYGGTVNALTYTNASNVLVNSSALTFNPSGNILTVSGNITAANVSTAGSIRAAGPLGQSAFISAGNNQLGGVGYHGFLEVTNTAATNPNKYFRLDSAGTIQIINSAYSQTIFNLTDAGDFTVPGKITSGNVISSGYGSFAGTFNESTTTAGVYAGIAGSPPASPRIGLFNGNSAQNWQIDNYNGSFRWFTPGVSRMSLDGNTGQLSVTATVSADKFTTTSGIFWANGAAYSAGGGSSFTGGIIASDIYPNANVTVNLGQAASRYWSNVYTSNVIVSNGIFWANGTTFSSGAADSLNSYIDGGGATTVYYAATDVILDAGASH